MYLNVYFNILLTAVFKTNLSRFILTGADMCIYKTRFTYFDLSKLKTCIYELKAFS